MGTKISFPHRYSARIDTGLEVKVEPGYRLGIALHWTIADRGMVATNADAGFKEGKVSLVILNCGREIVEIKDGDPIATVWLERELDFDWQLDI